MAASGCTPPPTPTLAPRTVALSPALNKPPASSSAGAGALPAGFAIGNGTPTLLHFFTTYSLPSLADTDLLVTLPPDKVLGISLDLDGEPAIDAWRHATGAAYAVATWAQWVAANPAALTQQPVVPTTLLIDAQGGIVFETSRALTAAQVADLGHRLAR